MMLDRDAARHLLARTGLGPRPAELDAAVGRPAEAVVDELLAGLSAEPVTAAPDWVDEPPPSRAERRERRDELRRRQRERVQELKAWWHAELLATPTPLTERLVLLWHDHFPTSFREVRAPGLLYRQNLLFRRHAAGSFRELLHAVARDPAMLLYLDTARSTRAHPNENFARELFELFTLGVGHYTEDDVREAARAFTGWTVDRDTGELRVSRRRHDGGMKEIFGRRGRFDGDAVIDLVLEQPQVARHIAARFWRAFISEEPDQSALDEHAEAFRDSDYDLSVLLRRTLLSEAFADPGQRGTRLKSPVELIAGTCRLLDLGPDDTTLLAQLGRRLGQDLFDPPSVEGWPGGNAWITSSTLVERHRILRRVAASDDLVEALRGGLGTWLGEPGLGGARAEARTTWVLLARPPVEPPPSGLGAAELVGRLLVDPAYQLT